MAERRNEQAFRIRGIDRDARNLLCVAQPEMRPRPAGVRRLVHAVARREIGAVQSLSRSHVDDVRIRDRDVDRADRARWLLVEDRRPHAAVVGGLPDTAAHHADVEHVRLARNSGRGLRASAAERSDVSPAERDTAGIEGGLRRECAGERERRRCGDEREEQGEAAGDGHDEPLADVNLQSAFDAQRE